MARIRFFLTLFCLGVLASPLQAATYKINWYLGHKNLDYFEDAALEFKKAVETGSKGDITVAIVLEASDQPATSQAKAPEIAAMVARGEVEMGHSFTDVMGGLDPRLHAFEAPYLFRGYRHMEGVIEGPLGTEMLEGLRAHGVHGLSFTYSGGANGLATTGREIRRPEDVKGMKVGVYGDAVDTAWLKALGATTFPIEHRIEDIIPAARTGALDATVITWRNFERASLNSDFRYVSLLNSSYLVSVTYINPKFFDSLPEKYRTLITKASREAGRIERARTIELNETARVEMLAKGVREVHLSPENRARFVKALQPAYKGTIETLLGADLIRKIKNTGDAAEHPAIHGDLSVR